MEALERAARDHADEWRRWGFRRDKAARATEQWQVYRDLEPDGPITDTSIDFKAKFPFSHLAEEACRVLRGEASARAAVTAFLEDEAHVERVARALSGFAGGFDIRSSAGQVHATQAHVAIAALRDALLIQDTATEEV